MKVLVACEFSGIVREAFRKRGHDAWSCDLLDTEIPGNHIKGDVLEVVNNGWDLMIAHPPCTYLSNAGLHYLKTRIGRRKKLEDAFDFIKNLYRAKIPKICIENPVGWLNTNWQKPTQIIHPYQFGEYELKKTCLWLKNIPVLLYTSIWERPKPKNTVFRKVGPKKGQAVHYYFHAGKTGHERSRTFQGIADAMAEQWG